MSYFNDTYDKLRYPISSDESYGLRNAQLGAVHAIASFHTLRKNSAGIIIMPTGSGKTAVLMITPYIVQAEKVLIVTPSAMVRSQIYDDFVDLITLKTSGAFADDVAPPVVCELKNLFSEELRPNVEGASVVVASPQCALSLSENQIREQFDLILIDEAHHVPATTWQQILLYIPNAKKYFFTATPFRQDKKEVIGEIIYSYPLSMAYRDGVFGEITYIPIEEAPEKDKKIAQEAERVFINDRQQGFDHFLMVRTIKQYIVALKEKEIDGIICVGMLGEGFDFPNLKIAAVHVPHKSLSSTLQFIGRFARTNAENIGAAKFIAMNDDELVIENNMLYRSDAIWQEIIIDMSERTIHLKEEVKKNLEKYIHNNGSQVLEEEISLHAIRLNCHAKVFFITDFNIDGNFPDIYCIKNIFRNADENTVIGIGAFRNKPIWSETAQVLDIQNLLFVVHYQSETSLLFIYSQLKNETDYKAIATAFANNIDKIPRNEMHRVLGELQNFEMFNTGIQNRYAENGESYRIIAGSNAASSIDPISGKMFSAGHVFCKASSAEEVITIGYSSGSKIWSSSYLSIPEYVKWCNYNGIKISNARMEVRTNTNYDFVPMPKRLEKFPEKIFFCFFSDRTYTSPPTLMRDGVSTNVILTDASIKIECYDDNHIEVIIALEELTDRIVCNIDGSYKCDNSTILLKDGRQSISLNDYLFEYPLIFKTTDDTVVEGNEICCGASDAVIFSPENIFSVRWDDYNTDINREFGQIIKGKKPIQTVLQEILIENNNFDYLIYDHTQGEIADYITIKDNKNSLEVVLYHVKAMHGKCYNSDLTDIYEVTQQAIKSVIWLKSRSGLLDKIKNRNKKGYCIFKKGKFTDLEKSLNQIKLLTAKIVVVQPAIKRISKCLLNTKKY